MFGLDIKYQGRNAHVYIVLKRVIFIMYVSVTLKLECFCQADAIMLSDRQCIVDTCSDSLTVSFSVFNGPDDKVCIQGLESLEKP